MELEIDGGFSVGLGVAMRCSFIWPWLALRCLPPLVLGGLVLLTRRGEPFMETFIASAWIGFGVHMCGWLWLSRGRALDAGTFLPLIVYYSRLSDLAWTGTHHAPWWWTAVSSYLIYLAWTGVIWLRHPETDGDPSEGRSSEGP